ncbi:Ubiquitin carboxyl-terminal hydrolase 3 [Balamuthia mandrillaris]
MTSVFAGIKNLGNTCYLNVLLQSLSSVPSFHVYLDNLGSQAPQHSLTQVLNRSIRSLTLGSELLDPTPLTRTQLSSKFPSLREQQDPQELMHHLFTLIQEENAVDTIRKPSYAPSASSSSTSTQKVRNSPFHGEMQSSLKCLGCFDRSAQRNVFLDLSLAINPNAKDNGDRYSRSYELLLENCMQQFTEKETLEGVHCDFCDLHDWMRSNNNKSPLLPISATQTFTKAQLKNLPLYDKTKELQGKTPKRKTEKQLLLSGLPRALCLHFRRLVAGHSSYGKFTKSNDYVKFPSSLRIDKSWKAKGSCVMPFLSAFSPDMVEQAFSPEMMKAAEEASIFNNVNGEEWRYSLVAVVVHEGNAHGGHYTVYRKLLRRGGFSSEEEYRKFVAAAKRRIEMEETLLQNALQPQQVRQALERKVRQEKEEELENGKEPAFQPHPSSPPSDSESPAEEEEDHQQREGATSVGAGSSAATDGQWVYISDEYCRLVSYEEVSRCKAYMLFYEKDPYS